MLARNGSPVQSSSVLPFLLQAGVKARSASATVLTDIPVFLAIGVQFRPDLSASSGRGYINHHRTPSPNVA
jgi:hypothetical protein